MPSAQLMSSRGTTTPWPLLTAVGHDVRRVPPIKSDVNGRWGPRGGGPWDPPTQSPFLPPKQAPWALVTPDHLVSQASAPPHAPCVSDGGAPCASDIKPPTPRPRDTCGPDATSTPSPAPHNTAPQQKRAAPPERGEGSPHHRTANQTRTQAEHHGPRLQNWDRTHGGSWTPALCPDPCPCLRPCTGASHTDRRAKARDALEGGAQPMPSHCPPDAKCQPELHL